jgi:hypothetical protein
VPVRAYAELVAALQRAILSHIVGARDRSRQTKPRSARSDDGVGPLPEAPPPFRVRYSKRFHRIVMFEESTEIDSSDDTLNGLHL